MSGAIRVLLVDDDEGFLDLTSTYLKRINQDVAVQTETSPADAVAHVRDSDSVDCVVSDYDMPGRSGLELFEALRYLEPDLPFILFTGKGSEEIASDAISAGVTDYLQKGGPEQYEVLANRIENAVSKYRAEREAAETTHQLGQIVDRISDAFFSVDRDWSIEFINDRAAEYIGRPKDALIGVDIREVVPEERAESYYEVYRRALETQEPETYQAESALKPGTWIEERVFPAEDGLSVYFRDVTERVQMEDELKETNQRITALHDVAASVAACDSEADIYDLTIEAAERILELDLCAVDEVVDGNLVPQSVSRGLVSDGVYNEIPVEAEDSLAAKTYRAGESFVVEDVHEAGYAPAEAEYRSAISVPVGSHGVFQAVNSEPGAFTDRDLELVELLTSHITVALNRLASETDLRSERDRFAALFENVPHAVARGSFDGDDPVVVDVNPEFERVFGFEADEIVGESPDDYIVPEDAAENAARVNERLRGGGEIDGREVRRECADGLRDFLLHTVVVGDDPDQEVFAIYIDITDQKQRERELELQNERLDDFASVVSHDLRNPLNVATGRADLLEQRCTCEEVEYEPLQQALDRMDALIEDVLALARHGSSATDTEAVDLRDVVERAWGTSETGDGELVVVDDLPTAELGPNRLREILENLFRNAVEHGTTSPSDGGEAVNHGTTSTASIGQLDAVDGEGAGDASTPAGASAGVTVRVGALDDGTGLYVEDDGPGIPADQRDQVFEHGYTTSDDGTGFGLAIVESIANAEDWTVELADAEHAATGTRLELAGLEARRVKSAP